MTANEALAIQNKILRLTDQQAELDREINQLEAALRTAPWECSTCDSSADVTILENKHSDAPAEFYCEGCGESWGFSEDCEGHPAGPNDPMGETVFCNGSCRGAR